MGLCRFGQYAPYLKRVLELGCGEALVLSPTSRNGYEEAGISNDFA